MARQPVRVQIFNQSYSVLVDGDPNDVHEIAHRIDELMFTISSRTAQGDPARVAVLACLHLADQLRTAEKQLQSFEDKSERFASLLETALDQSS